MQYSSYVGLALLFVAGCHTAAADAPVPAAEPSAEIPAAAPSASNGHEEHKEGRAKRGETNRTYSLPFVRDPDIEDPSDRAHGFLRQMTRDNGAFMRGHDPKYFKTFAEAQKPRATIVTCSDSRVQSPAFDARPENDLFTIRNIGNQLATAEGSIEYGVGHLKTPMLVILGHSGCGAVKAAMGDFSQQPPAIRHEIETIDLSPLAAKGDAEKGAKEARSEKSADSERPKNVDAQSWIDAVVLNVNHQVATALDMFADRVTERELIVVGAVYDFRNDMKQGYGSLNIVNVNGHTEPAKIAAFVKAIDDLPGTLPESAIANMSSLGSSFRSGAPSSPERSPVGAHAERAPAANNERSLGAERSLGGFTFDRGSVLAKAGGHEK